MTALEKWESKLSPINATFPLPVTAGANNLKNQISKVLVMEPTTSCDIINCIFWVILYPAFIQILTFINNHRW